MIAALIIAVISLWYAWRYSRTEDIDPDWAMFNLAGFTGSWYGRDFVDCKSPAIHIYFYALSRLVGKNIKRIKFTHHLLMGLSGIPIAALSGNFGAGLAFCVLVNSGHLLAFHGNVGQIPAILIGLAMVVPDAWTAADVIGCGLAAAAVVVEPKLLPVAAAMVILQGWWLPAGVLSIMAIILILIIQNTQVFRWLWEANVTIGSRIQKLRKGLYPWVPWYTREGLTYILPWIIAAVLVKPDLKYWIPVTIYALILGMGRVIRENHLIPFIPWIALAGIPPAWICALVLVDWISAGLYMGDIWSRFYIGLRWKNEEARLIGNWLRDKPGSVWCNDITCSAVAVHARKPILFGMAEQLEIRETAKERRDKMRHAWRQQPPQWVVTGPDPSAKFIPEGYQAASRTNSLTVYEKKQAFGKN